MNEERVMVNVVTGIPATPLKQNEQKEAKEDIYNLIADRVPEITFVPVKDGRAIKMADGQYAIINLTVKKAYDIEAEAKAEDVKRQDAAKKAKDQAEAEAKKNAEGK